jgi:glycosyltransferase involved in cell wall biosynthesis
MRALFLYSGMEWTGSARAFLVAAKGLLSRGYQVTYVCADGSEVEGRVLSAGASIDVVAARMDAVLPRIAWRLQKTIVDNFVEVVFVHSEREQLAAATAIHQAERGALVRRVPAGASLETGNSTRLASRLAASGYLLTTRDGDSNLDLPPRALGAVVADLGVDVASVDAQIGGASGSNGGRVRRGDGLRPIVCVYSPTGKQRAATVLRTLAMLAPRHPDLRLVFLGPSSDDQDLRMHAAALGVNHLVSHLGQRDDYLGVMAEAELGWVVADGDDAGYGALDFMALHVPVITDRGTVAARYVADGITGALLPPGETSAVSATVAALLARDEERVAMGKAGRSRVVRAFTEGAMIDGFTRAAAAARDRSRWVK